jgi:hypothetical protein
VVPVVRRLIGGITVPSTDHVTKNKGSEYPQCRHFKLYPGLCQACKQKE